MDDDVLNMPNWGYYEPFKGGNLGLNLMPGMNDRETKPFFPGRDPAMLVGGNEAFDPRDSVATNGAFHPRDNVAGNGSFHPRDSVAGNGAFHPRDGVAGNGAFHPRDSVAAVESPAPINYVRDNWMNQRPRFYNMQVTNPNYAGVPETSQAASFPFIPPADPSRNENEGEAEELAVKKEGGKPKKRKSKSAVTTPKAKKPKKVKDDSNVSAQGVKPLKKTVALEINGVEMDISGLPVPVCSCTGNPQQCYRWGCGGWQSACCTTNVSIYPLPMSVKRRGARIAGRKMSQGAFKKVLEKLVAQGYNFANPIDLKTHWARHGTNKFVTIR